MPYPIKITDEIKQKTIEKFALSLNNVKLLDGELVYRETFNQTEDNLLIQISLNAYRKIIYLLTEFDKEVGWHGVVSLREQNEYVIEDIIIYPQVVTSVTVSTDINSYTEWLYNLDEEVFTKIRMHGHSHCTMSVTPSSTDITHRHSILSQLESNMFYIFMIWNKSFKSHTTVYDLVNNKYYENDEIIVNILQDEELREFQKNASKFITYLDINTLDKANTVEKSSKIYKTNFGNLRKKSNKNLEFCDYFDWANEDLRERSSYGVS